MPSDKRNSITAKARGLIFSLFNIVSVQEVPFDIPQYVQCVLHGLTSVLHCVPFIFAESKRCRFGRAHDGFPLKRKLSVFFIVAIMIVEVLFEQFLIRNAVRVTG